jgi:uncharacterized protein YqeY
MSENNQSISQEQYDLLIEKLTKVEEAFSKDDLREIVEKLTADIAVIKEIEVPEGLSEEDVQKMIDGTVKTVTDEQETRIEKLEKLPVFKGPEEKGPEEKKTYDVLKGVLRNSFPEVRVDE